MKEYKFKKEWTNGTEEKVIKIFSKWERKNLIITYGRREKTVSDTYGLPYTSSSSFAMISNCNVEAELKADKEYNFEYIAVTEQNEIVVVCWNRDEKEKYIVIGNL